MDAEIGDLEEVAGASDSSAMILTCPACATRYFIPDDAIPSAGRAVRCSSCRTVWRVVPDEMALPEPVAETHEAPRTEASPAPIVDDPLPELFTLRAGAAPSRRPNRAGPILAAAAGVVVVVLGVVALFRTEIERIWPATSGAYESVLGE